MSTVWTSRQDSCFCSLLAAANDKEHEDFALLLKSYTCWIVSALPVVSQFSIWGRLRDARAGGQWRLSDYAHGLESFWSNCLQGVHDHNEISAKNLRNIFTEGSGASSLMGWTPGALRWSPVRFFLTTCSWHPSSGRAMQPVDRSSRTNFRHRAENGASGKDPSLSIVAGACLTGHRPNSTDSPCE